MIDFNLDLLNIINTLTSKRTDTLTTILDMYKVTKIIFNTLKLFGSYWAKGKLAELYFYEKRERVQLSFFATILFLMA